VAAIDAAAEAGVRDVVYTSAVAPRPDTNPLPNSHYWTEQALASSLIPDWTILRNSIYAEMILMGLPQAVASGQLFAATDGRGRSYVTREDCAHVAAAAPTSDFDGKRTLDVTGPTPVTQDELAAIAGKLAGRRVDHVELQAKDLRNGMVASGLRDIYADVLVALDVDAAHGYHAVATPVVEQLNRRISQPQRGHGGACLPRRPLERRKGDLTSLHACVSKSRKRLGTARRTAFIDWR
jgi:NAD(P)H dehydrogenase (quinone)